jgi:hypothetical protein
MSTIELEAKFILAMKDVMSLDKLRVSFNEKFNEGMADLAFLRFRDEIKGFSLNPSSFKITPALRVLNLNNSSEGRIHTLMDKKDFEFSLSPEEEYDEDQLILMKKEIEKRESNSKRLSHDEIIIDSFGIYNDDPQIMKIQKSFKSALDSLISIANLLQKIHKK